MNSIDNRTIYQFYNGQFQLKTDVVVLEHPVTIKINGKEFMTIVCTPEYIIDMVVGFLISEKIIIHYKHIKEIWIEDSLSFIHIETDKIFPFYEKMHNKRYITSCCGMSRQGFVFANDALAAKQITEQSIILKPEKCFELMNEMEQLAKTFKKTGGVHNAALCDQNGVVISRMDIGRHNALDKIYGYCLKHKIPIHDKIIVFSGRISSEILLKVAKIGCQIILSKSAPTELALNLANDLGITVVGFIREHSFNLYTYPERIYFRT